MREAVQLPRRKHRRSLSPEFQHAFALEVLKTERLRIVALIVVATAVALGLGAVDLLAPATLDRIWHGRFPVLFLATSYIVFVSFEVSVLALITRQIKRGGDVPQLRRYIGAFVETSLPSVVIATHMSNMGAAQALAFVGPLLYFVFIILSTLRLDFWLSTFTGFVAGAELLGLALFHPAAAMPLLVGPLSWLILRAVIGFGCSGLFITTESWLNAKAEPAERGRIFSVYMFGTFLALALGQLLIGQAQVETGRPFNAIAVLFAVALVIVSTTRAEPPRATASTSLPFGQLSRAAPVAVAGCMVSGLVSASFYSLVPAWMQDEGIARETIATFMLIAVLGGLAFQVPIGRLSDRFDRRIVLSMLSFGFAVVAIAVVNLPHSDAVILPAAALLGGFMSTLYPVCVANAHDQMPADQVIVVSGRLILVSGLGSILGPLIGTSMMARFSIDGVFYFMAAVGLLLALLAAARRLVTAPPTHRERTFEILAPQATPLAHDLLGPPTRVPTSQKTE